MRQVNIQIKNLQIIALKWGQKAADGRHNKVSQWRWTKGKGGKHPVQVQKAGQ